MYYFYCMYYVRIFHSILLYCNVLCTVLYCTVLSCTILYFTVLYCTCTLLYCTILYCTVLYCIVLCCSVLYCTELGMALHSTHNPEWVLLISRSVTNEFKPSPSNLTGCGGCAWLRPVVYWYEGRYQSSDMYMP